MVQDLSTIDVIVQKLKSHLDKQFWIGKGDRKQFKNAIKKLESEGILSKKEYTYLIKNERPILIKTRLIHLIPELQSQTVLESTLSNIVSIILETRVKSGKREQEVIESLLDEIRKHLENSFNPKITSLSDGLSYLINMIQNSKDIERDYLKVSELLQKMRDELLELGESRRTVYEIDKLAKKFANLARTNPAQQPQREELIEEIKKAIRLKGG